MPLLNSGLIHSRCLLYTVHKAASMFLYRLMLDISTETNVPFYSINKPEFQDTIKNSSWKKFIESQPGNGYFGPIRSLEAMPIFPEKMNEYSVILHLRDPRDVLVSLFFSYTYSHTRGKSFNVQESQRQQWQQDGIDLFVVEYLENCRERYLLLIERLLPLNNVILLKYEDMVNDYAKWLKSFLDGCFCRYDFDVDVRIPSSLESNPKDALYERLVEKYKDEFSRVNLSENIYHHKRQVLPGDHIRKLKAETIEQLNDGLRDILIQLGYEDTF